MRLCGCLIGVIAILSTGGCGRGPIKPLREAARPADGGRPFSIPDTGDLVQVPDSGFIDTGVFDTGGPAVCGPSPVDFAFSISGVPNLPVPIPYRVASVRRGVVLEAESTGERVEIDYRGPDVFSRLGVGERVYLIVERDPSPVRDSLLIGLLDTSLEPITFLYDLNSDQVLNLGGNWVDDDCEPGQVDPFCGPAITQRLELVTPDGRMITVRQGEETVSEGVRLGVMIAYRFADGVCDGYGAVRRAGYVAQQ